MTGKETGKDKKKYREPKRIFESSGVVNPEGAYHVPLANVTNTYKQDIKTMTDRGRYFSMFAPRQSGKTTFLDGIRKELHIIETKINRYNFTRTLKDGITQVSEKYLASESVDEGYLVIFDIKTQVGEECEPLHHPVGNKKITSFAIGIGRPD